MTDRYWKIYYDDGTIYSATDGSPEEAPLDGVQAIVQNHNDGNIDVITGQNYYYWMEDHWAYGPVSDLEKWLRRDIPQIKYGRFASNELFNRIYANANKSRIRMIDGRRKG